MSPMRIVKIAGVLGLFGALGMESSARAQAPAATVRGGTVAPRYVLQGPNAYGYYYYVLMPQPASVAPTAARQPARTGVATNVMTTARPLNAAATTAPSVRRRDHIRGWDIPIAKPWLKPLR